MLILLVLSCGWACLATLLLFRNPLPFPDKGHRLYGVPDAAAQMAVTRILARFGLPLLFRIHSGPTDQALAWDGTTVINHVEAAFRSKANLSGNGISIPTLDPRHAADHAMLMLREAGFEAAEIRGIDDGMPSNYLVAVTSNAFLGWILVFRRPGWQMFRLSLHKRAKASHAGK